MFEIVHRVAKYLEPCFASPAVYIPLSVAAIVTGFYVLKRFWKKSQEGQPIEPWDKYCILLWTFVPPLWFFLQYYVVKWADTTSIELVDIKEGQELAGKFWAAILAAMLFLKPDNPKKNRGAI